MKEYEILKKSNGVTFYQPVETIEETKRSMKQFYDKCNEIFKDRKEFFVKAADLKKDKKNIFI